MKKRKRLLAVILAAAICATSAVPSFAAGTAYGIQRESEKETKLNEGWNVIDGRKYFVKDGKIQKSWFNYKGSKYYLNPSKGGAAEVGLVKIKNNLYYFDKKGRMLKSRYGYQIGKEYYSASSKGVLTKLSTAAGLAGIQLDKLKGSTPAAFRWASNIKYKNIKLPAGKNPAKYYGEYAFKYKTGDCNVQAYAFYWMAKVRGYNIRVVKGYVPTAVDSRGKPTKFGAHTWCEIKSGDRTLVCDPNFAAYYDGGYKFTYGTKGTYRYYDKNKNLIMKK